MGLDMTILADATPLGFILTADRARAKAFYADVMGFPLQVEDAFGAVFDMAGLTVRLTDIAGHRAGPHAILGWTVPDIRASVRALAARGVTCTIYPGFGHDDDGVWTSPDGKTALAWFPDPDGNMLSLAQKG
jgi:catechol 2,3-dioxygenase-like lactoylglutathione lyase family enzyme